VVGLRLAPGQGVAGWVVQRGEPLLVPAAQQDARFFSGVDSQTGFRTRTMLAVPIKLEARPIGVIEVINPSADQFGKDALRLLLSVSELAAAAMHNAALYERARQAEWRYESLFDEGNDPVLVLDLEGKVLDLNQRAVEVFQCSRAEVLGTGYCGLMMISPAECREAVNQVSKGQRQTLEIKIPSGEGVSILEAHMIKINYGGREAIQWVGHDISERVALERMREDLTHMVIHDLRNPLNSIMGSLQLIHTAFVERDATLPVSKLLRIAMRSGNKLYMLIDSLLDLRRLEMGEAELNKTLIAAEELVREAVEQIQPLALNKHQKISVEITRDLPRFVADRDLILRVLTNLLDNAVKFTPPKGQVTLEVGPAESRILFTVTDTGPGIPPEYRQSVFERFTRLRRSEGVKGTGLGLAFCKLAIEGHGGRIWVESEPGQGSQFMFTLPLEVGQAG